MKRKQRLSKKYDSKHASVMKNKRREQLIEIGK